MKALVSYLAVAALIVASSFTAANQKQMGQSVNNCFNRFNVHRAGKSNIEITWSVSESNISQFVIERSYDGEFYESVNSINFNGSSSYKSKDVGVFPGTIYYRVTALKSDGSSECSPVETIRIMQHG